MARKRMIDPNIWQSEDFSKLSTLGKLVFIGLFSLADDEGRGRCNPVYIKSSLFPYEESIRSADIEKTLSEISSNMSVIFYSHNGSNYYSLYNWNYWQKIDRPSESKLPEYDKETMQLLFDECSTSNRRALVPNRKEKNKNENIKENTEFVPPTIDEVRKYIQEKKLRVEAEQFHNYFSEGNWIDSKGNKVKNWKQKLLTWNGFIANKENKNKLQYRNYDQREYDNFEKFYANKGSDTNDYENDEAIKF